MAFALTSFWSDGYKAQGPGPYKGSQTCVFTITGLTTDVALDIGTFSGTFWTDALANATYGTMATQVLAFLPKITGQVQCVSRLFVPELVGRQSAASPSGTSYTVSIDATTKLPIYTFAASNGATAYTVFVDYLLNPTVLPTTGAYHIQIP